MLLGLASAESLSSVQICLAALMACLPNQAKIMYTRFKLIEATGIFQEFIKINIKLI